ncbi:MAG: hypothetical protein GXP43_01530 [bacterium]|nr:hypothetical protein [bacterium]
MIRRLGLVVVIGLFFLAVAASVGKNSRRLEKEGVKVGKLVKKIQKTKPLADKIAFPKQYFQSSVIKGCFTNGEHELFAVNDFYFLPNKNPCQADLIDVKTPTAGSSAAVYVSDMVCAGNGLQDPIKLSLKVKEYNLVIGLDEGVFGVVSTGCGSGFYGRVFGVSASQNGDKLNIAALGKMTELSWAKKFSDAYFILGNAKESLVPIEQQWHFMPREYQMLLFLLRDRQVVLQAVIPTILKYGVDVDIKNEVFYREPRIAWQEQKNYLAFVELAERDSADYLKFVDLNKNERPVVVTISNDSERFRTVAFDENGWLWVLSSYHQKKGKGEKFVLSSYQIADNIVNQFDKVAKIDIGQISKVGEKDYLKLSVKNQRATISQVFPDSANKKSRLVTTLPLPY